MKKILYLMHCEWRWIKQRPHFIAELLGEENEVHVAYRRSYKNNSFQTTPKNEKLNYHEIFLLPKLDSLGPLKIVNDKLLGIKVRSLQRKIKPDVIYVCSPVFVDCISKDYNGQIIYDCMDDHSLLTTSDPCIVEKEKKVVKRADVILASSLYLQNVVLPRRGDVANKITLVRNGFMPAKREIRPVDTEKNSELFNVCYIGTVSHWFDFEALEACVKKNKNTMFHIIGPVNEEIKSAHSSSRIKFYGTVEHNQLASYVANMDCLVMPFIINDIVKAVDPVKLYEYIDFGKDIICSKYDEIERFDKFVSFYSSTEEFCQRIDELIKQSRRKYSEKERIEFLNENSWNERVKIIEQLF